MYLSFKYGSYEGERNERWFTPDRFDYIVIDEFHHAVAAQQYLRIVNYFHPKFLLGRRPSRMDLFTYMDDEIYELCLNHRPVNIFKDYLSFLNDMGRLTAKEQRLYDGVGRDLLNFLETTQMTKAYKNASAPRVLQRRRHTHEFERRATP